MKKYIYAVYDAKLNAFDDPFVLRTEGEALRGWTDAVNNEKTKFNQHPEDYVLFELGEYDYIDGKVEAYKTPKSVAKATTVKKPVAQMEFPINPKITEAKRDQVQQ